MLSPYTIFIFLAGILFFTTAIVVLFWAASTGQFEDLNEQALSVFNEEEPEGVLTDSFPNNSKHSNKT